MATGQGEHMATRPWYAQVVQPVLELTEYLGGAFDPALCSGDDALVADEARRYASPLSFYKHNRVYLYHLTFANMDLWRDPVYVFILQNSMPCAVLDYGCGIGAAGLLLAHYGYYPAFADYQSECLRYLKWRLQRRRLAYAVYDVERDEIPRYPLAVALDVLEHVPPQEQTAFLAKLAEKGERVIVNLINHVAAYGDTGIHYPVDAGALVAWVQDNLRLHIAAEGFNGMCLMCYSEKEQA